jgi:hypothetical protein
MAEHVAEAVDAVAIPLGERARRESHLRWFDHVAEAAGRSATTPSLAPLREVDAPSASAGTPRAPAREAPAVGRSWWWAAALAAAFTCGALLARWVLPTP